MLKVPAVQCLQLLVIMTEMTSCQTLKPYIQKCYQSKLVKIL